MSYILDALRKSDQQRQRGATPTLLTAQESAAEPRQFAYLTYGLIAAVLVGAGIVIGWLHPWQSEQPISAGETVAAKPLESSPRQTAPAPVTPALVNVSPRPAPSLSNAETRGMPPKAVTTAPTQALTRAPEKPGSTGLTDPAQEQRVMALGELPLSILQDLPGMQISLHLHSTKPANSFVSINNQMLQEGAYPAPGLRLEQITPDGMIFSYKGYRFRRGVQ
jgi:general secretion pathway protein B